MNNSIPPAFYAEGETMWNNGIKPEEPLTKTILQSELDLLLESDEVVNWLEKEASHIQLSNGINWYRTQWRERGLKEALDEENATL